MRESKVLFKHGSLFSGIGGFDLAAQWCGWDNVFHCEISEFCNQVLAHYWPRAVAIKDIRSYDWKKWKNRIDVLSGGFPCQPYSVAGQRRGKDDPRHLWPEMLRAIVEIRPGWVVAENVRGLISWNGGLVFEEVQSDLEAAGYEVLPFLLPAAGVGAPHRRERIWIIGCRKDGKNAAYTNNRSEQEQQECGAKARNDASTAWEGAGSCSGGGDMDRGIAKGIRRLAKSTSILSPATANAHRCKRCEGWMYSFGYQEAKSNPCTCATWDVREAWKDFPTQPPLCDGNDGFSGQLDGIAFSKWRSESIKAGGNAIVPQVAYQIFSAINGFLIADKTR